MIEARGLTKNFGDVKAVRNATFTVEKGSVTGFVGPNGSGKTTILRMVCGIIKPTSGKILVNGTDPSEHPLRVKKLLSYLPGETSLYLHMRGKEFLDFISGIRKNTDLDLQERLVEIFHIPLERRIRTYSAGMKQKLSLAFALSADVGLLVLDEPTRALDATMRIQFIEAVRMLKEEGKTFFISSHHLADIESLCDDMIFLLEGQVIPKERIKSLMERLSSLVRVKLQNGATIHDLGLGPAIRYEEKGNIVVIHPDRHPRLLVRELTGKPIEGISWGRAELDEIYKVLFLEKTEESP